MWFGDKNVTKPDNLDGDGQNRTDNFRLAKPTFYQLNYTPLKKFYHFLILATTEFKFK